MATFPAFEPYILTPLDHCLPRFHLFPSFIFRIDSPSSAIPILSLAIPQLMRFLPFLTGNVTASTQLEGKENVLEVQPPTQEFLNKYPFLHIKHHRQSISCAMPGSNVTLSKSVRENFIPIPLDMAGESESPVFRVQANIMSDGLILCLAFHHMALDGVGLVNVATGLATCCRDSQAEIGSLPTNPLREQKSRKSIFEIGHCTENPQPVEANLGEYVWDFDSSPDAEEPISKTLAIDASKVEQIRAQCQLAIKHSSMSPKPRLTSNSVASALLWYCWIRAKYHGSDAAEMPTHTESRILTLVELRDRIEPCLPRTYMGNATLSAETSTRIQQILSGTTVDHKTNHSCHLHGHEIEQISKLSISLQDSAASINSQYIRNVITKIVSSDNWASIPPPADIVISSIRQMKVYELDFGPIFGPLRHLSMEFNPLPGVCWINPARFNSRLAPWEFVISSTPSFMRQFQQEILMKWLILKDGPRL